MRRLVRSCGLLLNFQPQKADLETFRRSRTVLDVPGRSRTFPDGPLVSACVRFCPDLWVDKKDNQGYFSNGWPIYFSRTPVISICRSDITWRIRHLSIWVYQMGPSGTVQDRPIVSDLSVGCFWLKENGKNKIIVLVITRNSKVSTLQQQRANSETPHATVSHWRTRRSCLCLLVRQGLSLMVQGLKPRQV